MVKTVLLLVDEAPHFTAVRGMRDGCETAARRRSLGHTDLRRLLRLILQLHYERDYQQWSGVRGSGGPGKGLLIPIPILSGCRRMSWLCADGIGIALSLSERVFHELVAMSRSTAPK